jgi:transposase
VRDFAEIMTRRRGQQKLEGWLIRAETSDLPELRSFANGVRRDQKAVTAGLTFHCARRVVRSCQVAPRAGARAAAT